ncbi:hypothetical protein CL629_01325 [bacterium]|nr:hypothetical protein [bacterium]|tara:strand:+ start:1024 stop:1482 length:459 start_codon:yes stop_codon:yes gene_type:complete
MADISTQKERTIAYEITYLVKDEKDASFMRSVLLKHEAVIVREDPIYKVQLEYPIESEKYAFLGIFVFEILQDNISKLSSDLRLDKKVLRYLITKPISRREERLIGGGVSEGPPPSLEKDVSPAPVKESPASTSSESLSNEALEKKIEEILE